MMLRVTVRDCLFLNWALPVEKLPEPPAPLRYQLHSWQGRDYVFASALLFHQDAVHLAALPRLRVGYPRLDLRFCVLDAQGVPSVLFRRMLMPAWITPRVRLLTHHPASRARLDFPRPSRHPGEGPWTWKVERDGSLEVRAWQHSPQVGEGPRLGTWEQTVRYFEERPRGYTENAGILHRVEAGVPQASCWPLRVEIQGGGILGSWLRLEQNGNGSSPVWPQVHSAWLCPEVPFVFELGLVPQIQIPPGVPSPAAGRVAAPVLRSGVFRPREPERIPLSGSGLRASIPPMNPTSSQRIAVLPGDGIGKDVTAEAVKVLSAAAEVWDLPLEMVHFDWDADRYLSTGETLPAGALDDFRKNYAAIFIGAFGDPRVPDMKHAADILLGIRFGLDLYINFRPVKLYDSRLCPLKGRTEKDVDFVVFRENTEGPYVNVGGNFKKGTAEEIAVQEEIHTRKGVERIIRAAFDYAVKNDRREVLMTDKSNVMRYGHDLWQRVFAEVSAEYPRIAARHMFVDSLTMEMVLRPETLDVIVANNMFGDIITDLAAAFQGGLGMAASANLHPGQTSMFEPVHGSAPKFAGTGRANPMGAVLSSALMLETLGHAGAARALEEAVIQAVRDDQTTPDLGGSLTTSQVGDALARSVSASGVQR